MGKCERAPLVHSMLSFVCTVRAYVHMSDHLSQPARPAQLVTHITHHYCHMLHLLHWAICRPQQLLRLRTKQPLHCATYALLPCSHLPHHVLVYKHGGISLDLGLHQDWEWDCVHISCATLRLHSNSLILRLRQDQECNSLILCFAFPESHANFGLPRTLDLIRNTSLLPDHSSCQG